MSSFKLFKAQMSWREAVRVYRQPQVLGMLFLGFAAGLPFLLVFSTLSAWLTESGLTRSAIGFFSWVGITYSIKIFWAPVVDRLPLPLLDRWLGRRRSWMLLAQCGIILGLLGMAGAHPGKSVEAIALFALLVAFSSATQDVALDAFRIESIDQEFQAAMAATYIGGYRLGLLVSGAGAFYIATFWGWPFAYMSMAACMLVGVVTVLIVREPDTRRDTQSYAQEERVIRYLENSTHLAEVWRKSTAWFIGAVVCPFTDFFQRNGALALFILLLIGVFRISDITMGVMAMPFYLDMGFTKIEIANISKVFGFFMTIVGAGAGGILVARFGIMRPLLLGAVMAAASNLLFAMLAGMGHNLPMLTLVISADNLSGGLATSAFIAYLSSLTNSAYTATQYALFSSLMTLLPKILAGFSGMVVDAQGYVFFFIYSTIIGIPAILLVLYLMKQGRGTRGKEREIPIP